MFLLKPKTEVFDMPKTFEEGLKHIELCGKVAYKSEDKITETSAVDFVKGLLRKQHFSVLRHLGLRLPIECFDVKPDSDYIYLKDGYWHGNLQAWMELNLGFVNYDLHLALPEIFPYDIEYCEWTKTNFSVDPDWQTVRFVCDRGVSHELVRHTCLAFTQESTRYCNYKGGVAYIIPPYAEIEEGEYGFSIHKVEEYCTTYKGLTYHFLSECLRNESEYKCMSMLGLKPQMARGYLNHMVKTEVVISGSLTKENHWPHFMSVRRDESTGPVHPQMLELTKDLKLWK